MSKKKSSQVQVFVRIRPVFFSENEEPEKTCIRSSSNTTLEMINLRNVKETLYYEFQQVFNENSSQDEVFGTIVQPILSHFTDDLQNVSIFAYGPTGSGKTYTILGSDEEPGFIPHTMRHLFARIRQMFIPTEVEVSLSMSYLEIYQEKIYDLLANSKKLEFIRQDVHGTISVPGLTESEITKFSDFEQLFVPASNTRRVAATRVNERSSRSHTLLILKLQTHELFAPYRKKTAKLSIIDLAGSEDNRLTGNKGVRLKESSAINTSLHVLGKVVNSLVSHQARVPYRDSKLTRLLQDSLGGSAHTSMVVNVSPEMSCIFDTHRALSFAVSSKSIINRPFTRESIVVPSPLRKHNKTIEEKENISVPIFSPALRKEAEKRKISLDKFDDMGNLTDLDTKTTPHSSQSVVDDDSKKHLLNEIHNSTRFFKMLQNQPEKITNPNQGETLQAFTNNSSEKIDFTSKTPSSKVFTIKKENNKYFLVTST